MPSKKKTEIKPGIKIFNKWDKITIKNETLV